MRAIILTRSLFEIISDFGLTDRLVGIPFPVSLSPSETVGQPSHPEVVGALTLKYPTIVFDDVQIERIQQLQPTDILVCFSSEKATKDELIAWRDQIHSRLELQASVHVFNLTGLESLLQFYEWLGGVFGVQDRGRDLGHRVKAQLMDLCNNFFPRMKNRKVAFVSSIEPLALAGGWIPDLIKECGAVPMHHLSGADDMLVDWKEIEAFRPDVMIIAPRKETTLDARKHFKELEKYHFWENLLAVKRGDVFFCGGLDHFYQPSTGMVNSVCILVSMVAGLESGYVAPRDSFYKLRWLEMQRHKI